MKIKITIRYILLLLTSISTIYAQQPQWLIANKTEETTKIIDFRSIGPITVNANPLDIDDDYDWVYSLKEGHNAIYDENGDLSAFITHNNIFDKTGNRLYELLDSDESFFQDFNSVDNTFIYDHTLAVVPVPEKCNQYYIFRHSYNELRHYKLSAYLFDTTINKLIDIDTGEIYSYDFEFIPGKNLYTHTTTFLPKRRSASNLSVTKMNSDGERFLLFEDMNNVHSVDFMRMHRVRITTDAVEYINTPFSTIEPTSWYFDAAYDGINETEVVSLPSGNLLYATTTVSVVDAISRIHLLLMNSESELLSRDVKEISGNVKGMEFSPDGDFLYLTKTEAPYLQYINTSSLEVNDLNPTFLSTDEEDYFNTHEDSYKYSAIEIANNGKMYYAGMNGLSSLEDPNNPFSLWINNEINIQIDMVGADVELPDIYRLIPLPEQVDGERFYATTIYLPDEIEICNSSFEELCGPFSGTSPEIFDYKWFKVDMSVPFVPAVSGSRCFTPDSYGTYVLKVTDENGCTQEKTIDIVPVQVEIPEIEDIFWCSNDTNEPNIVGWPYNPFVDITCPFPFSWTYNDTPVASSSSYQVPFQGEGTYCLSIIVDAGNIISRCFEVIDCCTPNAEFSLTWSVSGDSQDITVINNSENTDHYASETFNLYADCNNDGAAGPWAFIDSVSRSSGFDDPITFNDLNPNCLYRIFHVVLNGCSNGIFTHTEFVGGNPGIVDQVSVFSNPTSGRFTLSIDNFNPQTNYIASIYNLQGLKLQETQLLDRSTIIDIGNYPQDIYILKIISNNGVSTIQVIKE